MPTPPTSIYRWGLALGLGAALLSLILPRLRFLFSTSDSLFCYAGGVFTSASLPTPGAACLVVADGAILRTLPSTSPGAQVRPGVAYPGLWDGHGHLLQYGEFLHSADLFGADSVDEVRARLGRFVGRHPGAGEDAGGEWIRGTGWDQMRLGGMPNADMLEEDAKLRGRYIMLDRVDVHCIWVSRAVLALLPNPIPDVPGGEVVRSPGLGVFCDNAMDMVMALWPRPGRDRKAAFLRSAVEALHAVGLVGMHDAGVQPDDLRLFEELSKTEDWWTLRVYAMVECKRRNTFCPDDIRKVMPEETDGMLSVQSVKLFADGALGSWGSALLEPYTDRPETSGSLLVNESTLTSLAESWARAGYQVNIHAIGDRANRATVDALEAGLRAACQPSSPLAACQASRRFRIEHAQIVHPAEQLRIAALGLIPSIQPTHATSDSPYAEARLGPARAAAEGYRMSSLRAHGLRLVLGSDFPVEPPDPLGGGVYAAVTRKSPAVPAGESGGGWHPQEALGLADALTGFTTGPAWGAFLEGKAGELREGSYADWIVLEERLDKLDEEGLRTIKIKETWVGGRRVYARD